MTQKVLIITHMAQMIAQFNEENIRILQDLGFEVHLAANFTSDYNTMSLDAMHAFSQQMRKQGVFVHQIDFERGVGRITTNVKVWNQLRNLADEQSFDLIHCQSPLGGVFGRLIGKSTIFQLFTPHMVFIFIKVDQSRTGSFFTLLNVIWPGLRIA